MCINGYAHDLPPATYICSRSTTYRLPPTHLKVMVRSRADTTPMVVGFSLRAS